MPRAAMGVPLVSLRYNAGILHSRRRSPSPCTRITVSSGTFGWRSNCQRLVRQSTESASPRRFSRDRRRQPSWCKQEWTTCWSWAPGVEEALLAFCSAQLPLSALNTLREWLWSSSRRATAWGCPPVMTAAVQVQDRRSGRQSSCCVLLCPDIAGGHTHTPSLPARGQQLLCCPCGVPDAKPMPRKRRCRWPVEEPALPTAGPRACQDTTEPATPSESDDHAPLQGIRDVTVGAAVWLGLALLLLARPAEMYGVCYDGPYGAKCIRRIDKGHPNAVGIVACAGSEAGLAFCLSSRRRELPAYARRATPVRRRVTRATARACGGRTLFPWAVRQSRPLRPPGAGAAAFGRGTAPSSPLTHAPR